jgi:hypothetical protein
MKSLRSSVQSDLDQPIVFRTTTESVYRSTIENGEIWLRSDEYFRKLEDKARNDVLESMSAAKHQMPLALQAPSDPPLNIEGDGHMNLEGDGHMNLEGDGHIAEQLGPHYILSLHGSSIAEPIRAEFGGFTFGVKNIDLLARHIFEECRKLIVCNQWSWDQIRYQHSALRISEDDKGAPIQFGHNPSRCLRIFHPNAFKKRPVPPFIHQDEWRIVIWTSGYVKDDPNEPLKVRVPPSLFYRYLESPIL